MKTNIHVIFDASGSMSPFVNDMVASYNEFVKKQRAVEGKCTISMTTFSNTSSTPIKNKDIHDNVLLEKNDSRYICSGMTALYDTVGKVMTELTSVNNKDTKNIVVILTDGDDNMSKQYSPAGVKEMIEHAESDLGYEVLFLGANIDVKKYASDLGVKFNKAMLLSGDAQGYAHGMEALSAASTLYRSGASSNSVDINNM